MDGSINSDNFSVSGYLPLIQNDSSTHVHGLTVYVKEGLPLARDLSLKNFANLLMFSTGFTSLSVLLLFLLPITPSLSLYTVLNVISSNRDEALSISDC